MLTSAPLQGSRQYIEAGKLLKSCLHHQLECEQFDGAQMVPFLHATLACTFQDQ
jgi:hypothetical protein